MTAAAAAVAAPHRRPWTGLALLAVPAFLVAVDVGALFLALPELAGDLGASATEQLWILDVYGFLLAALLVTMGAIGDRFGRRRLLVVGCAAFGVSSAAAALSTTTIQLIVARSAMGVAAATLMPSTLGLIRGLFPDEQQRSRAIAVWATAQFAGGAFGPVVAGVLLERFWWGSVFVLNVPLTLAVVVFARHALPEERTGGPNRIDAWSIFLSLVGVLGLVWALKVQATAARPEVGAIIGVAIGVLACALFIRRQSRIPVPLLDLALLRRRRVASVLAALVVVSSLLAGAGLLVTQHLQLVEGLAPAATALWFAPMALGIAAGTFTTTFVERRVGAARSIAGGLTISAAGFVLLTAADGRLDVVGAVVLVALGAGPLFALGTHMVVTAASTNRAASAAAMAETGNQLGANLGLAVFGSVAALMYRLGIEGGSESEGAADSLAGAVAVADELPHGAAAGLLDSARASFRNGLTALGVVGAVLSAAAAVVVLLGLSARDASPPVDDDAVARANAR